MIRSTYALVLIVCGGLVLSACGKKKDDADATAASGSASASAAPPVTATATAAPADTATAAPSGSASAAPPDTAAPVVNNAPPQRPIDDCCIALATTAATRRRGKHKNDAFRAAEICPGIANLVRQGRATRSQALTQIRSALAGERSPASCQN
jgi:CCR4-NOT transcriptional regulation complex NOT5 subunit